MNARTLSRFLAILSPGAMVLLSAGCAPVGPTASGGPPQGCLLGVSYTAQNTAIGTALGAGIGAAASGGNLGYTALGGVVGGLLGNAIGQQQDAECHAYAVQQALQVAMEEDARARQAQQAAYEQEQQQAAAEREAERQAERRGERRAAARYQRRIAELEKNTSSEQTHSYKSTTWKSGSGRTGTITPLNSFTDPATKEVCYNVSDSQANGQSHYCRDAKGNWVLASAK